MKKMLLLVLMCVSPQLYALEIEGVNLEDSMQLDTHQLVLSGAGVRTKFFFKVYVAGLYLAEKKHTAAAVLEETGAKRMQFNMLRNVSGKQMLEAINDTFPLNSSAEEMQALESRLNDFSKIFATINELKKGQLVVFDYLPGIGTRISVDGVDKGRIVGVDFYRALLKMWVGEKPAQADLKQSLLGGK